MFRFLGKITSLHCRGHKPCSLSLFLLIIKRVINCSIIVLGVQKFFLGVHKGVQVVRKWIEKEENIRITEIP